MWRGEEGGVLAQSDGRRGLGRRALMATPPPTLSSIALDPLYPSRCSWETFGYATSTSMAQASDGLSPLQLSGQLNSLPCSLAFRQEETISIIRLIEQVGALGAGPAGGGALGGAVGVGCGGAARGGGRGLTGPAGGRAPEGGSPPTPCEALLGPRQISSPLPLPGRNIWGIWLLLKLYQLSLPVLRLGTPPTASASASSSCCSAS